MRTCIALICLALGQAVTASAQEPAPLQGRPVAISRGPVAVPIALDDSESRELAAWIKEYQSWQDWEVRWGNRRQWIAYPFPYPFWKETPDVFSYVAPRRVEPTPPEWLQESCARFGNPLEDPALRVEGCRLLQVWKDDYVTHQVRVATAAARTQRDEPSKTRVLEHIHFASLWTNLDVGGSRAYGLAGVHATVDVRGRWQIYTLPGVMVVSLPNVQGQRTVTVGYDWGMAVRLFDGRVPYVGLPVKVHLNLVQVWMPEVHQKIAMTGLSFTASRSR